MTVSRGGATTLLISFTSKIEEAVILVPRMGVTEKLKAVQFWNVVSERLQDIVNKNAADINAVASKMADTDKLCMEMNNLTDGMNPLNSTSTFINPSSSSEIYNEYNNQFHNPDLSHSKHHFHQEMIVSSDETLNQQTEIIHSHHINQDVSHNRIENTGEQLQEGTNLPAYSCNALSESSSNTQPQEQPESSNIFSRSDTAIESSNNQELPRPLVQNKNLDGDPNAHSSVLSLFRNEKVTTIESSKLEHSVPSDYKKLDTNPLNDSEQSLLGDDFESHLNMDDLDENSEHIGSFSSIDKKEILEHNEVFQKKNKKTCNVDTSFDCKICGKHCSNQAALKQHNITHKKPYSCTECTSVFATNASLIVHMRRHTGEKPYSCQQCSACFSTQGNLKRHIGKHNGVKRFQCDKCDSRFTEKKSLDIHMRRHTGERPYKCELCGNGFAQSGVLESHMAMHLGIKKHLCETCGKAFRQKSQLRIHKLRHDKVKKYKCDTCSMLFLTKADLERHAKTHSGEKPYACDVCNKRFTRQQSLNDHLNRHYNIKPYSCQHCGMKFVEMSAYYKHVKTHKDKKDNQERSGVNLEHEVQKPTEHQPVSRVGNAENVMPLLKAKNTDSDMTSIEGTQYIAVVLNEEGREVQNLNSQTILCNSSNSESNIVTNNFGVLTALNMLSNASIVPGGFLS